ncbi:MAG: hypothetical protein M1823_008882, partial [Watsoniomyces obsoletus]
MPLKPRDVNPAAPQRSVSQPNRVKSLVTDRLKLEEIANSSSDETSIAPEQPAIQRPGSRIPPGVVVDKQPQTITLGEAQSRGPTPLEVFTEQESP